MSDDLVSRLLDRSHGEVWALRCAAANRIEALEAQRDIDGTTILLLTAERDRLRGHFEDATADYKRDRERDEALLRQALEALTEACKIVGSAWAWRDEKGRPCVAALRARLGEP